MSDELTLPVHVVFATPTSDGLLVDCTVAARVGADGPVEIPPGAPFSLLIDPPCGGSGGGATALAILSRWCAEGAVVHATTSSTTRRLVLSDDSAELVLEVV